jgi:hypothetical protein
MKTHVLWCSAAAICLVTCVQAFAGEGATHQRSPAIRPGSGAGLALQGLFCNSAAQIDETVTHMRKGLSPRASVELVNREAVVCTFVDLLRYVVDRPVVIKEIPGSFPLFKYEGTLVAVVVGDAVRPVTPPVRIFFAIPERLSDAPLEGRA